MIDKQRHATQTANPIAMVIVEGINLAAVALQPSAHRSQSKSSSAPDTHARPTAPAGRDPHTHRTVMTRNSLTSEAQAGYADANAEPPFLFSSSAWLAWRAGQELARRGMPKPKAARPSRGYSVKIIPDRGSEILIAFNGDDLNTITITQKA